MRSTHRQKKHRLIKLVSLNDRNVYGQPDHGPGKDGGVTTSRGQLLGMLDKVEKVGGREFPLFLLSEPPDTDLFGPEHEFDRKHLKDHRNGEWLTPTPEWLAERDRRCGALEVRKDRNRRVLEAQHSHVAMKGLASVVASAAKEAATSEAAEKKHAEKKHEATKEK